MVWLVLRFLRADHRIFGNSRWVVLSGAGKPWFFLQNTRSPWFSASYLCNLKRNKNEQTKIEPRMKQQPQNIQKKSPAVRQRCQGFQKKGSAFQQPSAGGVSPWTSNFRVIWGRFKNRRSDHSSNQ